MWRHHATLDAEEGKEERTGNGVSRKHHHSNGGKTTLTTLHNMVVARSMAEAGVSGYAWLTFLLPEERIIVFGKDNNAAFVIIGKNSTPAEGATKSQIGIAKTQGQRLQMFKKALSEILYDCMKLRVF
jgi:hypothetical protein